MLAKQSAEMFFSGGFGKLYPRNFIEHMDDLLDKSRGTSIEQVSHFDYEAKVGETLIEVILKLRVKEKELEEDI